MADSKISALPASTTPLAGTEVLPIVQSSTTKQVSVANLTAGRSFEALGITLTSTDAGASAAPLLDLYRDSATPAASDTLGEIEFNGEDSAGNKQAYGLIHASILSPTSTAEQGQLHFETATAGALTEKMIIGTTNLVVNEIGAVFNVRVEGDTDANLLYTDATNDRVGVGTITPATKLDVNGDLTVKVQVKSTNSTSTTEKYVIERVFDLFKTGSGSPTTLSICDITSSLATGGMFVEVVVTGEFADFAGLEGSYVSGMVSADTGTFNQINRYDGPLVGIIGFSSVSSGVVNVNIASMRASGFNGVAYVRVVCGNAVSSSNVIPSGVTIS